MRLYKIVSVKKQEIDEIICNVCGQTIPKDRFGLFEDHIHLEKIWGYNSTHDGEKIILDICQKCFDKIASQIVIPPTDSSAETDLHNSNEILD